jgi:hypothetical protein
MPNKELIYYLKNESNPDDLYHIAVTCIETLEKEKKAMAIKAIIDAGTSSLVKVIQEQQAQQ